MSLFADYTPERRGEPLPPEDLSIRPARGSDAAPIGRLIAEREGRSMESGVDEGQREIARSESDEPFLLCVAAADEEVIAFGRCGRFEPAAENEPCTAPDGWYLLGIIVDPEFRRRSVGCELTRFRMRWVAERAREVYYFVNALNRASIDLHEKLGFVELTREFSVPGISFVGGGGVLFRAELRGSESA